MAERKRVGFIFSYNENWIAGTYYILNIIHALNTLDSAEQPEVVIFTDDPKNMALIREETTYPFLQYIQFPKKLSLFQRVMNKLGSFFNKTIYSLQIKDPDIDFLYPFQHKHIVSKHLKKVYWIPDFQVEFLPELFSEEEKAKRRKQNSTIAAQADIVVFSSEDAKNHFYQLYPNSKADTFVLRFAVTHPDFSLLNKKEVLEKHALPKHYFFSPNQFWAHKNHRVILEAVALLKEKGKEVFVAFSGKDFDFRNQEYVDSLKQYIKDHHIEKNIFFLGFLDRREQLVIMQQSVAVIQPSLFEGWSTVVEDAKALNKHIILSDLDVHKEQVQYNFDMFNRKDAIALSQHMEKYIESFPTIKEQIDYEQSRMKFGKDFEKLIFIAKNT